MEVPKISRHTILELLNWAKSYFDNIGLESPRLEAEIILSHVLDIKKIELYLNHNRTLSIIEVFECVKLINRKANREPVAYIVGSREFWSLEFEVGSSVLIPRPETECLVSSVLPFLGNDSAVSMNVLDLGTGSGTIVVALAKERPWHCFYASDVSYSALSVAKKNAYRNNVNERISFFISYWTDALKPGTAFFDLIISNPPYVKSDELSCLQPEVFMYEPVLALDGGINGLDCLKRVMNDSLSHLRTGGLLALEIGYDQGNQIKDIASLCGGYSDIKVLKDYNGLDRVAHMTRI